MQDVVIHLGYVSAVEGWLVKEGESWRIIHVQVGTGLRETWSKAGSLDRFSQARILYSGSRGRLERDGDLWASSTVERAAGKAEESLFTSVRLVGLLGASPIPPLLIRLVHQLCTFQRSPPHTHTLHRFIPASQPSLETGNNFSDEKTRLREVKACGIAQKRVRPQTLSRAHLSWCSSSHLHCQLFLLQPPQSLFLQTHQALLTKPPQSEAWPGVGLHVPPSKQAA